MGNAALFMPAPLVPAAEDEMGRALPPQLLLQPVGKALLR